jgi:predicted DNA-binding transcriptional regulator YafY
VVGKLLVRAKQQNSISNKQILNASFVTLSKELTPNTLGPLPKNLKGLGEFVARQQEIEIIYNGGTHRGVFRPVRPVGLLPVPGGQALYALCLLSNQHKHFSLNKIQQFRARESDQLTD